MNHARAKAEDSSWRRLYGIGGIAALVAILIVVAEMGVTFLPGWSASPETVVD